MKNVYYILVACVAGYLGGLVSRQVSVDAAGPTALRADRFQLANTVGGNAAVWELSADGESRIAFSDKRGVVVLEIGVHADGRPLLRMRGRDGKNRVLMTLDQADEPMFGMGDAHSEGRVQLGFMPPDTFPYHDWDRWGLIFRAPGSEHAVVGMGTINRPDNATEPFLTIAGKRIER